MVKVIATSKGYFGGIVRDPGEGFNVPKEVWDVPKRRPSWVKLDPADAFGGKGDHDGNGSVGGSVPHATVHASASAGAGEGGKPDDAKSFTIPADWSSLHHAKRKAFAKLISGEAVADLAVADSIIAAYVEANKPAPFGDAPEPQTVAQAQKAIGGTVPDWVDPNAPKAVDD